MLMSRARFTCRVRRSPYRTCSSQSSQTSRLPTHWVARLYYWQQHCCLFARYYTSLRAPFRDAFVPSCTHWELPLAPAHCEFDYTAVVVTADEPITPTRVFNHYLVQQPPTETTAIKVVARRVCKYNFAHPCPPPALHTLTCRTCIIVVLVGSHWSGLLYGVSRDTGSHHVISRFSVRLPMGPRRMPRDTAGCQVRSSMFPQDTAGCQVRSRVLLHVPAGSRAVPCAPSWFPCARLCSHVFSHVPTWCPA